MIKKSPCPSCISRRTGPGRALATATAVNGLRQILGTGGLLTPAFRGSCGVINSGRLDASGADYVNVCQDGRKSIGTGVSYTEIGWTPPDTLCHVTCQQSTYWTLSQTRVSKALERIRQLVPSHTRRRSRMRESCTYGSGRGARGETRVPTATCARQSWCDPAGESPAQVRSSVRLVASVAWALATVLAKRTQRLHGVWD